MRRFISLLTITLISFSWSSSVAAEPHFSDVLPENPLFPAIEYLNREGIFNGYADGNFGIDREMNRAELMTVVTRGLDIEPDPAVYKNCFPDVTDQWFAAAVCYAKEQGWVQGYETGEFMPAKSVTTEQALKIILRPTFADQIDAQTEAEIIEGNKFYAAMGYIYMDPNKWSAPYIAFANGKNILDLSQYQVAALLSKPILRQNVADLLFKSRFVGENDWDIYQAFLSDRLLLKEGLSDLVPLPHCYAFKDNKDTPFMRAHLEEMYGALNERFITQSSSEGLSSVPQRDTPILNPWQVCIKKDGSVLYSASVSLAEQENMWHVTQFDQNGIVIREDSISCPGNPWYQSLTDNRLEQDYGFGMEEREAFELIGCGYLRSGNRIYFAEHHIEGVSADSFEVLGNQFSRDSNQAYYQHLSIDGAHAPSFEAVGDDYAKDKNHVYYRWSVVEGADPATFKYLEGGYVKDQHRVFTGGIDFTQRIGVPVDVDSFEVIFDEETLALYTKDKNHVYAGYYVSPADPTTFEPISREYARDSEHAYHVGKLIEGLNPDQMEIMPFYVAELDFTEEIFARDGTTIYFSDKRLESDILDVESAVPVDRYALEDKNGYYCEVDHSGSDDVVYCK